MYYNLPYTCTTSAAKFKFILSLKVTVQLKGNLIPIHMLQVEYCRIKITSCVQYMNGHPLRLCLHQANCLACAPTNITLFV